LTLLNLDFRSLFSDFYFFLIFSDLISPCFFLMYFFLITMFLCYFSLILCYCVRINLGKKVIEKLEIIR
jgi:hypothetical protein